MGGRLQRENLRKSLKIVEQIEIIVYYLLWFGLGWLVLASQAVIDTAKKGAWTLVGVGLLCTWMLKSVEKSLERPSIEAESPVTDAPGLIQGGVEVSLGSAPLALFLRGEQGFLSTALQAGGLAGLQLAVP